MSTKTKKPADVDLIGLLKDLRDYVMTMAAFGRQSERRTGLIGRIDVAMADPQTRIEAAVDRDKSMARLTPTQAEMVRAVVGVQVNLGVSPTMQELADGFGVSKVTICEHVTAMERKGVLRRDRHKARSIELL